MTVDLFISINEGIDYLRAHSTGFTYISAPIIRSILPKLAVENTTFAVQVIGDFHDFHLIKNVNQIICRVGTETFHGSIINSQLAICYASIQKAGLFSLGFSLNNQDFIYPDDSNLLISPRLNLKQVSPSAIFSDSKTQSMELIIESIQNVWNMFQNVNVQIYLNNTEFTAEFTQISPAEGKLNANIFSLPEGKYEISVRSRALGSSLLVQDLFLDVIKVPKISSISPTIITSDSITSLEIIGQFHHVDNLKCIFNLNSENQNEKYLTGVMQYSSLNKIICDIDLSSLNNLIKLYKPNYLYIGFSFHSANVFLSTISVTTPPKIFNFYPDKAILGDLSLININGHFFRYNTVPICRIGDMTFNATFSNESSLLCEFTIQEMGVYFVSISIDGYNFITANQTLEVKKSPRFLDNSRGVSLCQLNSPLDVLVIKGSGFNAFKDNLRCKVSDIISSPLSISDDQILCLCPTHHTSFPKISNASNTIFDFSIILGMGPSKLFSSSFQFYDIANSHLKDKYFYKQTLLDSIIIEHDYITHSINTDSANGLCRFRRSESSIFFSDILSITDKYTECALPKDAINDLGVVLVDYSFNNYSYIYAGEFSVVNLPYIEKTSPTYGLSNNNAFPLHVTLSFIAEVTDFECMLGSVAFPAVLSSDKFSYILTCNIPPLQPGAYFLSIKLNNILTDPVSFQIFPTINILSTSGNLMLTNNMGDVKFQLSSLPLNVKKSDLMCQLNHTSIFEIETSFDFASNQVICSLHQLYLDSGDYTLSLFLANSYIGSSIVTVLGDPIIQNVTPNRVLRNSNEKLIVTLKDPLDIGYSVNCLFGTIRVSALKINSTTLLCSLPDYDSDLQLMLKLSINNVSSSSGYPLLLYSPVNISSIFPTFGSESGNTKVIIKGKYFQSNLPYFCLFGTQKVPAFYQTTTQLYCYTPAGKPMLTYFALQMDSNIVSIPDLIPFTYIPDPIIYNVNPSDASIYGSSIYLLDIF